MNINALPSEVLADILALAAKANETEGPTYSYGLNTIEPLLEPHKARPTKYIRGPLSSQDLRWYATSSIRQVCGKWHFWALEYALEHLMVQMWRGEQRWLELPRHPKQYSSYEIINRQLGHFCWCPGHTSLQKTDSLLITNPSIGTHIRRLWFNGLHLAKTDQHILSIVSRCPKLRFLSAPWSILRRGCTQDWIDLLKVNTAMPLYSLELQSVCILPYKADALEEETLLTSPLDDPRIDFGALKRLKIFGNTLSKPICDRDLELIARTATGLELLEITNNSTTTVAGVLALVQASRSTLQVLEHSPRSDDGFFHPFPGHLSSSEHICHLITSLPQLRDLSISLPHICHDLFTNPRVNWSGECQIRAISLCDCSHSNRSSDKPIATAVPTRELRKVLSAARSLMQERARLHAHLSLELFFHHCVFDPAQHLVHGDFVLAELRSNSAWPPPARAHERRCSVKGPFGTSGVYGKHDDGPWTAVTEEEYFFAVEQGWILL